MLLQVRDALEKQNFVSQGDVIEQDQMLVGFGPCRLHVSCRLAARHDDVPSRFDIPRSRSHLFDIGLAVGSFRPEFGLVESSSISLE